MLRHILWRVIHIVSPYHLFWEVPKNVVHKILDWKTEGSVRPAYECGLYIACLGVS